MLVDIHTHAFHPKIASRAVVHLNEHYRLNCACEGTIDDLRRRERKAGIDHFVVLCAATSEAQVIPANAYAVTLQQTYPEVTAFGTLHPDHGNWEKRLEELRTAGIRGIKLHPDFQGFRLDDPRLLPMFEAAQKDFVFLIHIGDVLPPERNPSCPYKLAALLDFFPALRVVAAHLGGYRHWEAALEVLIGRNVWLDTSSCTPFISDALLKEILNRHPRERLLFGTDYPLFDPFEERMRLQQRTGFSDAELERIMENGAALLFG